MEWLPLSDSRRQRIRQFLERTRTFQDINTGDIKYHFHSLYFRIIVNLGLPLIVKMVRALREEIMLLNFLFQFLEGRCSVNCYGMNG